MRISDWSSDVCSSDLPELGLTPATSNRSMGSTSQADVGNGYNVNPDGTIQFPFIGPIKVAGLTENEARELLTKRLSKYVQDPQITVRVQADRKSTRLHSSH